MAINREQAKQFIKEFDFKNLLIEVLGWNNAGSKQTLPVQVDGQIFGLQPLAEKVGLVVLGCNLPKIPDRKLRRQLDREVTKLYYEHLIVFTDSAKTTQIWQWVRREPGKPEACRDYTYHKTNPSSSEGLLQKLENLYFSLSEEEELNTVVVAGRVKKGFDVETVTKKFYERFDKERRAFLAFIEGIENQSSREWYASLMLNRLMFIYFIQKKGFLAGDPDYLRNRLKLVQTQQGKNKFHSFYREFLLVLFHQGLGSQKRDPQLVQLLGKVPYLNGGLFDVHELERANPAIEIPDEAFEKVFNFFDAYQWHLDERPLRRNDEINPDVLGYIFEKYINQKQMGAYYTKEDITEYISKNTILPFLFDKAQDKCEIAFESGGTVWGLLQADPDRYIYKTVKHGVEEALPPGIEAGVNEVARREGWNKVALEEYALPTEIWREVVARRKRYAEVRAKLAAGEISSVNDLITYNLDIRQFAEDVIDNSEGSNLLEAFYEAISQVTVLDPTCGSGAFLFAALNILEPLYEACLERMQDFIDEADQGKPNPSRYAGFRKILQEVSRHPNRRYFILRSIILQNLYGVDIMEEAVEIAKLRLFLKLAAQVECDVDKPNFGLEPLPDVDFNIKAGNTLVGFATQAETNAAIDRKFDFDGAKDRINQRAQEVARGYQSFRQLQTVLDLGDLDMYAAKHSLQASLDELRTELDRYLAAEYGVDYLQTGKKAEYEKRLQTWRQSHQPFHWWVEFYSIMHNGGFDVIIGNPPWKEYAAVKRDYTIRNYSSESCGNLHGLCTERGLHLRSKKGRMSFIVQLPLASSSRMISVRNLLQTQSESLFVVPFDDRPGKLFEGLQHCRSVIFISEGRSNTNKVKLATARYQRWPTETRKNLFAQLEYAPIIGKPIYTDQFPKYANSLEESLFQKVNANGNKTVKTTLSKSVTDHFIFYQEATQYWVKATVGLPYYAKNGVIGVPPHGRYLYFSHPEVAQVVSALLNSNLFYVYFIGYSDCFHLSDQLVSGFPITSPLLHNGNLVGLNKQLMEDLRTNAEKKTISTSSGDEISYAEFYGSKSKPIIDEIDRVLAQHYGFTDEELDFIINYDIKYRMSRDSGEDEGEE